jgi:hypothetical protein
MEHLMLARENQSQIWRNMYKGIFTLQGKTKEKTLRYLLQGQGCVYSEHVMM